MARKKLKEAQEAIPNKSIPPKTLSKYTIKVDVHLAQDVENYVNSQVGDEKVEHVELVKEEIVLGTTYQIWDVSTGKSQWWVISDPMNLYDKDHFRSLDYTLSFHIGLMARISSRNAQAEPTEYDPFDELGRRRDQANARIQTAIESEDFQAVGLMLRENMILLVNVFRKLSPKVLVDGEINDIKGADFVGWTDFHISKICTGSSNKELRHYLKVMCKETWTLVNWLTHDNNANSRSATIALHAVDTIFGHLISIFIRNRADDLDGCPRCKSRNIRQHYDISIPPDGDYYSSCGVCGWESRITRSTIESEVS
jgi:hypothetical protein